MAVPIGVVELDEPRAALDQTSRQQTIAGEGGLAFFDSIQILRGLGFAG